MLSIPKLAGFCLKTPNPELQGQFDKFRKAKLYSLSLCCDKPFQKTIFVFKICLMLYIISFVFYKFMGDR